MEKILEKKPNNSTERSLILKTEVYEKVLQEHQELWETAQLTLKARELAKYPISSLNALSGLNSNHFVKNIDRVLPDSILPIVDEDDFIAKTIASLHWIKVEDTRNELSFFKYNPNINYEDEEASFGVDKPLSDKNVGLKSNTSFINVAPRTWTTVYTLVNVMPWQGLVIATQDRSRFAYKIYGAGIPFYVKKTHNPGFSKVFLGWCGVYAKVKVRTNYGATFEVTPEPFW